MIVMTDEQRSIIAYAIRDDLTPEEWLLHAVAGLGEEAAEKALTSKVERYRQKWEAAGRPAAVGGA